MLLTMKTGVSFICGGHIYT